jgi:hypothetical protein
MPVPGGTTRKLAKALAPAQELVALAVALVLELDVLLEGLRGVPKSSTMTEWSMTRSTGTSGIDLLGIAARALPWRRASPPDRPRPARR